MESAIRQLLQALSAIDDEGLGDTIVRDFMGQDVFDGFFKPKAGFQPSGEYDLSKDANRRVAEALGQFCTRATAAAEREGLNSFQQRVAAFQNPKITISGNVNYEDFFGVVDAGSYDESGNKKPQSKPTKPAPTRRRGWIFDRAGTIESLMRTLNASGPWQWTATEDSMDDPLLECTPRAGAKVQIREGLECMEPDGSITPPEYGFMALLEAGAKDIDALEGTFQTLLKKIQAVNVSEKSDYYW